MESTLLPPLIDSHCHLDADYGGKTATVLVAEARAAAVSPLITIGTTLSSSTQARALCETLDDLYFTVGVDPHDASGMTDADLPALETLAAHPRCVAVGEIGLDYHYMLSPADVQRRRLAQQLELAASLRLPVVIHSREAEPDLLEALTRYARSVAPGQPPGVLHCFSGRPKFAMNCLELGFYVSFSGILTFKNAHELRDLAARLPLDRLLVETDSPYLAPVPFRGQRCEPRLVRHTAAALAALRGLPEAELCAATVANTRRLFQPIN